MDEYADEFDVVDEELDGMRMPKVETATREVDGAGADEVDDEDAAVDEDVDGVDEAVDEGSAVAVTPSVVVDVAAAAKRTSEPEERRTKNKHTSVKEEQKNKHTSVKEEQKTNIYQ